MVSPSVLLRPRAALPAPEFSPVQEDDHLDVQATRFEAVTDLGRGRIDRATQNRAMPGATGTSTNLGFDEPIASSNAECSSSRPEAVFEETP